MPEHDPANFRSYLEYVGTIVDDAWFSIVAEDPRFDWALKLLLFNANEPDRLEEAHLFAEVAEDYGLCPEEMATMINRYDPLVSE